MMSRSGVPTPVVAPAVAAAATALPTSAPCAAALGLPLGGGEEAAAHGGAAAPAAAAGPASVCGALLAAAAAGAARRGARRRREGSRVQLGGKKAPFPSECHFRAKPGDKYTYRVSEDMLNPEWGVWPPRAPDREVKWGHVVYHGTPSGEQEWREREKAKKDIDVDRLAGAKESRGALLLDCDGTIVETERDGHRVAFNQAFKELGYDCEWEVGLYGELLTTGGGKERMTRYFTDYNPDAWPHDEPPAKDNPKIMELHELKTKLFMDIVRSGQLPLREGIEDLVTAAFTAGWKVGVCSTSNEQAVRAVVETLLPEFAPEIAIFAGDIVAKKKPDPEIYNLAAKELGVAPMRCVVLEDASIGARAAKAAGMQVIVTKSIYTEDEDFSTADEVLSSAEEIDFEEDVMAIIPTLQMS